MSSLKQGLSAFKAATAEMSVAADAPDNYATLLAEFKEQAAKKYERYQHEPPLFLAHPHALGVIMTGTYGITPERAALLADFEAYESLVVKDKKDFTGVSPSLLDGNYIGKSDSTKRLAKYSDTLTKLRTERDNPSLSETVRSYLDNWFWHKYYGCTEPQISTPQMKKGNECEQESIELYNTVFGTNYAKNTVRLTSSFLDGECDILAGPMIVDIKTSWDLKTYLTNRKNAEADKYNMDYIWQGQAYMSLYDADRYQIAYCLVDTPEELMRYNEKYREDGTATGYGIYSHLPAAERVFIVPFERDDVKIAKIEERVKLCQVYILELWQKMKTPKEHEVLQF